MQDGKVYKGEFRDNQFSGNGTLTWPDKKTVYVGEFKNGKRDGKGKINFADGKVYEGSWKAGLEDGPGILTVHNKRVHGIWRGGKLIEQKSII